MLRSSAEGWVAIEVQGELPNIAGITLPEEAPECFDHMAQRCCVPRLEKHVNKLAPMHRGSWKWSCPKTLRAGEPIKCGASARDSRHSFCRPWAFF